MARKSKREPGGQPVKQTQTISPVAAEIRKFQEAANSCPVHSPCNPLKYCPKRNKR